MSATSDHLNQDRLKKLAARENLTFLGLTLPYLLMVALLIVIPVGWLFISHLSAGMARFLLKIMS